MNKNLIILIVIAVLLFGIAAYYFVQQFSQGTGTEENETVFCTLEVKLCDDGSEVGRNPDNNCEFYPCPGEGVSGTFPEGTSTQTHEISIQNFAFSPKELTIQVGDTVIWTNLQSVQHTVTSDSGAELGSEYLSKGETYSHTFTTIGNFPYHCIPHPSMKGEIIVE